MKVRFGFVAALLAAGIGCDRSSPTEPEAVGAGVEIVFLDATLSPFEATIAALVEETLAAVNTELRLAGTRFTVAGDARRTIPGWGIGGYTLSATEIDLVIDPEFPALDRVLAARLPQIVAHELHHTARWGTTGPPGTLLEALIFEGLADHFAVELLGAPIAPWSMAFPPSQTEGYLDRARPELDSLRYDFDAWFFGIGTDLPVWTGYTLGFRLVRDYQRENPGRSAAELVDTPADAFRPD